MLCEVMHMPTVSSAVNLQYGYTIGRGEQFGPGFTQPVFAARGEGDLLYVLCRASEYRPEGTRITVCTVDEEYVTSFARGVPAQGPHEFSFEDGSLVWPTAIAFDRDWNVYVTDEWLNRISIFTKDGDYIGKWEERPGSGDGELNRPSGLAFDADDNVYIADGGNNRIQKFTKDGRFLAKWGTAGRGPGEFNMPWGIDLDSQGNVYVADWRNDRIQKFSPDGRFLLQFGTSGTGEGQFNRPSGIAVDNDGVSYVADWLNNRLQVFDPEGNFVTLRTGDATISKWAKEKLDANAEMWTERERAYGLEREKDFWGPTGVAVDDEDRVFVVESARNRIQVYRKLSPTFVGPRL
jgi:DNA-binding beta-propeller fold protein YncE